MQRIEKYIFSWKNDQLKKLLRIAGRAALEAGKILIRLYNQPHHIKFKGEIDLVTEGDLASEKAILAILESEGSNIAVLSEESHADYKEIPTGPVWVIDPLDGTTNYAHGFPWFAVSIALMDKGKSQVGVIYAPLQDELFFACRGRGARLNGELINVSAVSDLSHALLGTGFPYDVRKNSTGILKALENILTGSQGIRRAGAAALDLAAVASGRLDGFWEVKLKPWDTAAGILLVQEAGGKVTDFQGEEFSPFVPEIASSNSKIHSQLIKKLSG